MAKRALIPIVLAAGLAGFFAAGLDAHLSFETLRDNRELLTGWVAENRIAALLVYAAAYAAAIAFSVPVGALATVSGGFLFGLWFGSAATVAGATLGATALFVAARTVLGDRLRARVGAALERMDSGFRDNAFNYLLVLRLVPLFPFFLVNIAPAFANVRLPTYVAATFLGIIPGTFVYTSVGNGLGAVFDSGGEPNLGIILEPEILLPILGISVLALVPVIYRRLRRGKPACHVAFDEATAVLAGNALLTHGFVVASNPEISPSAKVRCEFVAAIAGAVGHRGMLGGQMADICGHQEGAGAEFVETLDQMKTGALIALSCETGAILAARGADFRANLRGFGSDIGTAFQITDDLLDVTGSQEALGKRVGKDQSANKATYVSILGVRGARLKADELVARGMGRLASFGEEAQMLRDFGPYMLNRRG